MVKSDKQKWVEKYKKVFKDTDFAFVFRCNQIRSEDMIAMRSGIKKAGGKVAFVKNTLAKVAIKETECESMSDLFKGISVLVTPANVGDADSYPTIVKSLFAPMKAKKDKILLAGGVFQGKFLDKSALEEFGKMPTRLELLSQVAFLMQYPLINVADVLKRASEK